MDYFYEGIQRLDWGLGNPNKTAALIATLVVAVWSAGVVWRKAFWFLLPVAIVLTVFLLQTVSRGGLVAAAVGSITVFIVLRPRWGWPRWLALVIAVIGLWMYASSLGVADRYVHGLGDVEDRSLTNRWLIYKSVPQMLVDAPHGWGEGNAPDAYHQWYQPEGRGETYINLVNSHFTWLVEWGTSKRLLYCLGWVAVMALTFPQKGRSWWMIVFAVWLTFFVAASFSSVAHHPWTWPLPLLGLGCILIDRLCFRRRISKPMLVGVPLVAASAYGLLLASSFVLSTRVQVHNDGHIVTVGDPHAAKKIAIIGKDEAILGKVPGHRLRAYVIAHPDTAFCLSDALTAPQRSCDQIVLVGEKIKNEDLTGLRSIVLLNPTLPPKHMEDVSFPIRVLWGDFHASHAWYAWRHLASKNDNITITRLAGEGTYLESWPKHLN